MAVLSIFVRSFVVVFADLFFLYFFLPVCLICYFITRSTAIRNAVLVVFSLIFYAWGEPVWVSILIVSSLVDYINGRVIEKHPEGWQAKAALAWSLVFNLGVLFGFKYTAFFVENLNNWFGLGIPVPNIVLPIGISFYTFQTISYTVDCYWGKVKPQKKLRQISFVCIHVPTARCRTYRKILRYRRGDKRKKDHRQGYLRRLFKNNPRTWQKGHYRK